MTTERKKLVFGLLGIAVLGYVVYAMKKQQDVATAQKLKDDELKKTAVAANVPATTVAPPSTQAPLTVSQPVSTVISANNTVNSAMDVSQAQNAVM